MLGQLAARHGELPPELRAQLEPLIRSPTARPFAEIQADLRAALGPAMLQIFSWIDPEPLARGWLGQAHRAKLRDGDRVAVYLCDRRYAGRSGERALRNLARSARWLRPWLSRRARRQLVRDACLAAQRELDLQQRARSLEGIGACFAEDPRIVVQRVYPDVSSAALLVSDWQATLPLTDAAALAERGVDPRDCAALVCEAYGRLLFERGLHHADPRPLEAAIAVDEPDAAPRLVLSDLGLCSHLAPELRTCLRQLLQAATLADRDGLQAALEDASVLPRRSRARAEPLIRELLAATDAAGADARVAETLERLAGLVARETEIFRVPPALAAYARTLNAVIELVRALVPGEDPRTRLVPQARKFLSVG